jgi:Protein of unknown function (DUF2934)
MAKSSKRPRAESASEPSQSADVSAPAPDSFAYDRDRVATRAYELYMARGAADGGDLDDWFNAERECCPPDAASPRRDE